MVRLKSGKKVKEKVTIDLVQRQLVRNFTDSFYYQRGTLCDEIVAFWMATPSFQDLRQFSVQPFKREGKWP